MATTHMRYPRVPLKTMDPAMLVFELSREADRLMSQRYSELITAAATMASYCHRNQTRLVRSSMPRVPYIEHPLRVALRLVRWGVTDGEIIAASLLHDVIEDCSAEIQQTFCNDDETVVECLSRCFSENVAQLVVDVTNPTDGTTYGEHIDALADSGSVALIIKASDLKDNAGSIRHQLGHGSDEKFIKMIGKYIPNVARVHDGLELIDERLGRHDSPYHRARLALDALAADLRSLAQEYSIDCTA